MLLSSVQLIFDMLTCVNLSNINIPRKVETDYGRKTIFQDAVKNLNYSAAFLRVCPGSLGPVNMDSRPFSLIVFLLLQFCVHLARQEFLRQRAHNSHEPLLSDRLTSGALALALPESLSQRTPKPRSERTHAGGSLTHKPCQMASFTTQLSEHHVLLVRWQQSADAAAR